MNLVIGFGPFIIFALLSRLSPDLALWAAFATAFVVTIRDFTERPVLRLLDTVSLILFGALALWRGFLDQGLSLEALRTIVDVGLTLTILVSLLLKRPFSVQYAGRAGWSESQFLRVNFVISFVWFAAFAAMALADALVTFEDQPLYLGIGVSIAAFALSILVTLRYPDSVKH
jgi:hypothetical protein